MAEIDWPAELDRTPVAERKRTQKFDSTIGSTTSAIASEMDRMGIDDWRASTASGGAHVKSNGLPKASANPEDPSFVLRWTDDGEQFAVACDAYDRLEDNAREVYLWVNETRMRDQRAVTTGQAGFAAAALPGPDDDIVVAGAAETPAHEVLGVAPDASDAEVERAFREQAKERHADVGGSNEEMVKLQQAREAMTR